MSVMIDQASCRGYVCLLSDGTGGQEKQAEAISMQERSQHDTSFQQSYSM